MSDTTAHEGASHRQGRGRRRGGRKFRGGSRGFGRQGPAHKPEARKKQTGFQKILSAVTFGLLGKPKAKGKPDRDDRSRARPSGGKPEARHERPPRPPREPQPPGEVTTERLYVGNLSYDATESDLFELFNGVGQVRNAEVVVNSRTQRSKGFAFVTMASVEQARRAVEELNGKDFMGRPLQVNGAKPATRADRPYRSEDHSEAEAAESAEVEAGNQSAD